MVTTTQKSKTRLLAGSVSCGIAAALIAVTSCERPIFDTLDGYDPDANVFLTFTPYGQEDFTRAAFSAAPAFSAGNGSAVATTPAVATTRTATHLADNLSRLSVAIFNAEGNKVKSINQKAGDDSFGTIGVSLEQGIYQVVAIAHNSTEGNATITSTEKVTFANNKMTDTFCYCGELTIGDSPIDKVLQMQRVVAMVRLKITGTIPKSIARFKFYYTGGSSTINPSTGYGCVNSKQTEYRDCFSAGDGSAVATYELFTAPHEMNDILKLVITAQDANNTAVNEWTMEDIPVTRNKITTWSGNLFGGAESTTNEGRLSLTIDAAWDGTQSYTW